MSRTMIQHGGSEAFTLLLLFDVIAGAKTANYRKQNPKTHPWRTVGTHPSIDSPQATSTVPNPSGGSKSPPCQESRHGVMIFYQRK
jgi:hypothetical protein